MSIKNKIILFSVLLSVLVILLIILLIRPLLVDIKNLSKELIKQKKELVLFEKEIEAVQVFQEKHPQLKPQLEKAKNLFIRAELPVDFIRFLEGISQDCQISPKISPVSSKRLIWDISSSTAFQLRISDSPFPDIFRFVEKLELSPYLLEIRNLNIYQSPEKKLESIILIKVLSQ